MSQHQCRLRLDRARVAAAAMLIAAVALLPGCGREPEAKEALRLTDVVTGWYDAGVVGGQNKLVPMISFRLRNEANQPISGVDLNAVFRIVGDHEELGSQYVRGIDRSGLEPSGVAGPFVMRSQLGYTGEQARVQMLQHTQFKDAQVDVFAKHGSSLPQKIAEFKIARQLLTR
jgi:hypothetical protein